MKVKAKQYARGLFESLEGKNKEESSQLINNFLNLMNRHQDLKLAQKVIAELEVLYKEAEGSSEVEIISARPLSNASKEKISDYLKKRTGLESVKLIESHDPSILGGFVLHYQGLVIDASLKNNLNKFKKQLSN